MPAFNLRPENYTIQHRKQIAALLEEAADIMTIKSVSFYGDQQRINEIRNTLLDDYNFALGAYRWPAATIVYEFKEVQVLFVLLVAAAIRAGDVLTS